ncbi:hypothetical protein [Streptomyces sp. NPDC055607]
MPFEVSWADRPGAEQVLELWSATSGEADEGLLGLCAGYRLLGPRESEHERAKWNGLMDGSGPYAVANPSWDESTSPDLTEECAAGWWVVEHAETGEGDSPFLRRQGQDLLNACRDRAFPAPLGV